MNIITFYYTLLPKQRFKMMKILTILQLVTTVIFSIHVIKFVLNNKASFGWSVSKSECKVLNPYEGEWIRGQYKGSIFDDLHTACNNVLVDRHTHQIWDISWLEYFFIQGFFYLIVCFIVLIITLYSFYFYYL